MITGAIRNQIDQIWNAFRADGISNPLERAVPAPPQGRRPSGGGWNTFPVPTLTEKNKADLTRCAEDILLAREAHFPATIADLYDPDKMPADLRAAHERNDEVLERIYIGRRFRNDTERLEKLFELYTKMTVGRSKARVSQGNRI